MSNTDEPSNVVFKVEDETPEPAPEPVTKKEKRKRPPLSEERKAQLREQLKRGRETSMANRQKKGLAKRLARKDEQDKQDEILAESLLKRAGKEVSPAASTPPKPKPAKEQRPKEAEVASGPTELELLKKEFAEFKLTFANQSKPVANLDKTQNDMIEKEQPAPKLESTWTPAPVETQIKVAPMRKKRGGFAF
jgi:hypothetical protein